MNAWYHLPFLFRLGTTLVIAAVFFGYLGLQVKKIVEPPSLDLFSPINGMITAESNLQIRGQTDKEVKVTINGKEIKNSEQGIFDETLPSPWCEYFDHCSREKHGKTKSETRYVVLENKPEFSLGDIPNNRN